jgi:hypothetical protein
MCCNKDDFHSAIGSQKAKTAFDRASMNAFFAASVWDLAGFNRPATCCITCREVGDGV